MILLSGKRLLALSASFAALALSPAHAVTQIGNVGSWEPTNADGVANPVDGVVGPAPTGNGRYDWVSTWGGVTGAARIEGYSGLATNGSELVSDAFYAAAGSKVSFWFNYVTGDGAQYADYGFAQLLNAGATGGQSVAANLFTARTRDDGGNTTPGRDLPAVEATLTPGNVVIQPGTTWSPLGGSSGGCFGGVGNGCGNTGWILSEYTVEASGSYQLRFGASNWSDTQVDSGLAFAGLLLNGTVIGDGSSPGNALLPGDLGPNGEFIFEITPVPQQPIFIDPIVSTGYTYSITGDNLITSAAFPGSTIPGQTIPGLGQQVGGFDVYTLDGITKLAENVFYYDFAGFAGGGVSGFQLKGIDTANMLNPANQTAFVTALTFLNGNAVTVTQAAQTTMVGEVPEPSMWMTLMVGFGLIGAAVRRRRAFAAA